jgi:glycosyltransferase involved in cell wall biosynthesis
MRIAVNTRALYRGELEGYGFFIEELFSRIIRSYPEHEFYFISDRPYSFEFSYLLNVKQKLIKPLSKVNRIQRGWFNWRLSSLLKKIKTDVLISIDEICSSSANIPQCLIVHDMHFLQTSKSQAKKSTKKSSNIFSKVTVLVTASESIKKDIQKEYHLSENSIHIIAHTASTLFQPVETEEKEKLKKMYAEGNEYFIYKDLFQSGKNAYTLLKAFSAFKKKQKSNMKLLIAVNSKTQSVDLIKQLATYKYREEVKVVEIINKQLLPKLVAGAYALVDLSGNKSFSYSVLEAIQCQTAAIVSNVSSVAEKEKDAYLFVNNNSFEDVAEKMMFLYKDENLRTKLIENGKKTTSRISWDEAAKKMWDCILQTSVS